MTKNEKCGSKMDSNVTHVGPADTIDLFHLDMSVRIICWIILGLTFLIGFFWNMLVWYPVYAARTLRTSMNALIVNLAIVDQLGCLVGIPILAIILAPRDVVPIPDDLCDVYLFVFTLGVTVQLLTLVSISFERYQAISHPFEKKKTLKRVQVSLFAVWIVGILVAMASLVSMPATPFILFCKQTPFQLSSYYNRYVFYIITPIGIFSLGVIIFFYGKIIVLVNAHVKKTNATLKRKKKSRVFPMDADDAMTVSQANPTHIVEFESAIPKDSNEAHAQNDRAETKLTNESLRGKSDPNIKQSLRTDINETVNPDQENRSSAVNRVNRSIRFSFGESIQHSACDLGVLQKDGFGHETNAHNDINDIAQNSDGQSLSEIHNKAHRRSIVTPPAKGTTPISILKGHQRAFKSFDANPGAHNSLAISTQKMSHRHSSPAALCQLQKRNNSIHIISESNHVQRLSLNTSINSRVKRISVIQNVLRKWKDTNSQADITDTISENSPEKLPLDLIAVKISDVKNEESETKGAEDALHSAIINADNNGASGRLVEVVGMDGDKTMATTNRAEIVGAICVFNPKNKERGKRKLEASAAKRAFFIICSYILCWLPHPLINFIFMQPTKNNIGIVNNLQMLTICLLLMTVALNPLLYGLINEQFKKEYRKILNKLKLHCSSERLSVE
ncbi:unnamed protein product [Owenia fusiformis]|uniref:Uncharacterized protein n=1 Tax=Owenia fusiformis TaxID=6347 RepID=A0A8J1T854_OWEFU|nr:unnamed protein product [Owenia fusiformis]